MDSIDTPKHGTPTGSEVGSLQGRLAIVMTEVSGSHKIGRGLQINSKRVRGRKRSPI